MLAHHVLQLQLLEDRRRELPLRAAPARSAEVPYVVESVKALWPLFTHRLFGIPAPPRTATGC